MKQALSYEISAYKIPIVIDIRLKFITDLFKTVYYFCKMVDNLVRDSGFEL